MNLKQIKTKGFDISHHNKQSLHDLQAAGAQFVIMKATQGLTYVDPTFVERNVKLRSGKYPELTFLRGAYHFYDQDEDPEAQALHFLSVVNPQPGDIRLTLDVEPTNPRHDLDTLVWRAAEVIKEKTGYFPFIYCPASLFETHFVAGRCGTSLPIWIAEYGVDEARVPCDIWQYSDGGSTNLDEDGYAGTIDEFRESHTIHALD